jgi:N,N-dimethylformamidase beta subunit-like protein
VSTTPVPGSQAEVPDIPLLGYPGHWSVQPGGQIEFMVSAAVPGYRAEIIRITGRGPRPDGSPPLSFEHVPSEVDGSYDGVMHQTVSGSHGACDQLEPAPGGDGWLAAWIYPTLPALGRWQSILTWLAQDGRPGLTLGIDDAGHLALRYRRADGRDGFVRSPGAVTAGCWHYAAASASPATGRLVVVLAERRPGAERPASVVSAEDAVAATPLGSRGYVAVLDPGAQHPGALSSVAAGSYNGKIDMPRIRPGALDADALLSRSGDVADGGGPVGIRYVHSPLRRVTGHNWTGRALDWRVCPAEYQAVWYHDDDLADAGWPPAFRWRVPRDARSGMYAARLTSGEHEDVISFYVRPGSDGPTAPLAVLVPTFTYTIYSNFHHPARAATVSAGGTPDEVASAFLGGHRELGLSLYCKHRDGSGVAHVSARRPMIDQRPWHRIVTRGNAGRELSGDLYLLDWLEHEGIGYDTITDDDLHAEGAELLRQYPAVVTGGHPEYVTGQMLDALAAYADGGGNVAYLGGNGFYWVTTVDADAPHVLEVRRGRSGSRTWTGLPGESHHTGGEPGGHWVDRGRAPQALVGVGFAAQGGGPGAGYRRTADSDDPRAAFVFAGIARDEVIGDFGLKLGGAAGDELDRADPVLGTPPGTLVLATSRGAHDDSYQRAVEEVEEMTSREGGSQSEFVRADMTYLETPGGGSVFSVGSIAWTASLPHAGYANNVARLTGNVLREFIRRGTGQPS